MDWNTLLNTTRLSSTMKSQSGSSDHRQDFQRDWDRIVFSTAFRRLHDKTQVFPLPDDDVVHSRLTHSLEVASVGRSLGSRSAQLLELPGGAVQNVGDIVAAACLAHDIGNPPFGHAGEDAIRRYFAKSPVEGLSDRQQDDLINYEGNAQGFRILSRLQFEEYGGMRLTAATLGAFLKYPRESGHDFDSKCAGAKKFGVFQSELAFLESLVKTLCLPSYFGAKGGRGWQRHPLAYLVEAADDICNAILDLEDACRLGWVSHDIFNTELRRIATSSPTHSLDTFRLYRNPRDGTGYLRAISIGVLVEECAVLFKSNAPAILSGTSIHPLVKLCSKNEALESLSRLARTKCYENPKVLEREAAGYAAITGLLERFVPASLKDEHSPGSLEGRMLQLLKQRALVDNADATNRYDRVLRVLDYISGMTDSYVIESFRRLAGVRT